VGHRLRQLLPMLFLDEHFTSHFDGMSPAESEALYGHVLAHLLSEPHVYGHQWRQGDLVVWDNLAVAHARQSLSDAGGRTLRRVTVNEYAIVELYAGAATRQTGLTFEAAS
jgi:taurine dioxygenase